MSRFLCVIGPQRLPMKAGERIRFCFRAPYPLIVECVSSEEDSSESVLDLAPLVSVSLEINNRRSLALGVLSMLPTHGVMAGFSGNRARDRGDDPVIYDGVQDGGAAMLMYGPKEGMPCLNPNDELAVVLRAEETRAGKAIVCAIGFGYRRRG